MMATEIEEKFKRHIQDSKIFQIGEDTFRFSALQYKHLPAFYEFFNRFSSMIPEDVAKRIQNGEKLADEEGMKYGKQMLDKEFIEQLVPLEYEMVKESYPELDDKMIGSFIRDNMFELLEPLISLNAKVDENVHKRSTDKTEDKEQ